jgi:CarD family transcriptional regulator, regulator of rRNA transcription
MAAHKKSPKKKKTTNSTKSKPSSVARSPQKRSIAKSSSTAARKHSAKKRGANATASARAPARRRMTGAKTSGARKANVKQATAKGQRSGAKRGASAKLQKTARSRVKSAKRPAPAAKKTSRVARPVKRLNRQPSPNRKASVRRIELKSRSKAGRKDQTLHTPVRNAPAPEPAAGTMAAAARLGESAAPASAVTPSVAKSTPSAAKGQPLAPRDAAPAAAKPAKAVSQRHAFKLGEYVVYLAHGVGQIVGIEEQEVAGFKLELFVIRFSKDKMTLRVPTSKVAGVGMRKISDPETARRSLEILAGRARVKRTMWARRAQEYGTKINSGDINAIAEVVRDLYRSEAQPEQSYSERQLYEAALDRMVREIAVVRKSNEIDALKAVEAQLQKSSASKPMRAQSIEINQAA